MEIEGKIKFIGETKEFGSNGFRKRELVITTEEQYPQHILVEFVQDKCEILNNYNVGESVKVSINLRGREWTNPEGEVKYFNTIQGWKINRTGAKANTPPPVPPADAFVPDNTFSDDEPDDLPFG